MMTIEEINKYYEDIKGFDYNNGIVIDKVSEDEVEAHVEVTGESMNPWGIVHGGVIFGLADTAMGVLASANGKKAVTIGSSINFINMCKKSVKAIAKKIKDGKSIGSYEVVVYNEKNEIAATMSANYFYLDK